MVACSSITHYFVDYFNFTMMYKNIFVAFHDFSKCRPASLRFCNLVRVISPVSHKRVGDFSHSSSSYGKTSQPVLKRLAKIRSTSALIYIVLLFQVPTTSSTRQTCSETRRYTIYVQSMLSTAMLTWSRSYRSVLVCCLLIYCKYFGTT